MKILELTDAKVVEDFLKEAGSSAGAEFLASLEWSKLFPNIKNLGVFSDDKKLLAVVNLSRQNIGAGQFYYYSPRGPVILTEEGGVWKFLATHLKNLGATFWRVEPFTLPAVVNFKKTINLQPQHTLMLDLSKSEEELLQEMHQKTRYNIRLAEKKKLEFIEGKTEQDFNDFWLLMQKTGERDAFGIHDKAHYQTLALTNPDFIKLFLVKEGSECLAAGLFSFYGNKVTYLHGASDHEKRQLMAPYLLQWELIKKAQSEAYLYYDFFGIDAVKWPGVTRFKLGFGGREIVYAGTNDLVFQPLSYNLYSLLRKIRRLV